MKKIDIFRPESFIAIFFFFLLTAGIGFLYWKNLTRPSTFSILFVLLSLSFYYVGVRFSKKFKLKKVNEYLPLAFLLLLTLYYSSVVSNFFNLSWEISLFATAIILAIAFKGFKLISKWQRPTLKFYKALMSLGFFFLVITFFQVGGIPLLDKALRFNLDTSWAWAPAIFFYMFGSVGLIMNVKERKQAYLIILVSTVLFALTGFRFALLLVLLSGTIAAYKSKKLDNKTVLIPLATAVLLVLFLGYFVAGLANPATLFLWRSSTTYNVYDQVLDQSMPFGVEHGKFLLNHAQPRDYLGEFLGAENSLTSTMLGPPLMEFGPIFALTWMFFLGVILGNAYISIEKKESLMRVFYPVLLALSIVWIETGFDQHMLWFIWTYLIMRWLK